MYALCVSGAVNTQGFVWKFFMRYIYKFSFIHSFTIKNRNKEATVSLKACQLCCLPISQPPPPLPAVHTQLQDFPHVQHRFTAASSYLHNVDKVILSKGVQDRLDCILHQLQGLSMGASTPVNNVSSILWTLCHAHCTAAPNNNLSRTKWHCTVAHIVNNVSWTLYSSSQQQLVMHKVTLCSRSCKQLNTHIIYCRSCPVNEMTCTSRINSPVSMTCNTRQTEPLQR